MSTTTSPASHTRTTGMPAMGESGSSSASELTVSLVRGGVRVTEGYRARTRMDRVAATPQCAPRHAPCAMHNAHATHMRLPRMHLAPVTIATWF